MKILITGAGGFIGQYLARELLKDPNNYLLLTDISNLVIPPKSQNPQNAELIRADLSSQADKVVRPDLDVVFILHGIMSAGAEAAFDLGFRVNVDATRSLLECIRSTAPGTRVIYASSLAIYGRPFPERITENVYPTPEGAYGAEKVICETLINEYTRRRYIDGFNVRLPGITVRPGAPTQAASSFLSGIIREPIAGRKCMVPTTDRTKAFWVCSPKVLVTNLICIMHLSTDVLPLHRRAVNAPGISVTIQEIRDSLEKVGGKEKLALLEEKEDTDFAELIQSWPCNFDISLALSLGLKAAESFDHTVEDYLQEVRHD